MKQKGNLKIAVRKLMRATEKNVPTILTVIGGVGLIGTVIFSVKVAPTCDEILEERKKDLDKVKEEKNEVREDGSSMPEKEYREKVLRVNLNTGKKLIKAALPAITCFTLTISCMFGANSINLRRISDISAAYELSRTSLEKFKEKTKEIVGDKKEMEIRESVYKEMMSDGNGQIFQTGRGDTLIFDTMSGRLFRGNKLFIDQRVVDLNMQLMGDMFISLNEFYQSIDLMPVKIGEYNGFNVEDGQISIDWTTMQAPVDGIDEPCWVMDYDISRRHRFGDGYYA